MDMFEGKEGFRIYKNKENAEFLANLARERDVETEILKVKVKDEKLAKRKGFTLHQDTSIASSPPSIGEQGWIVLKGGEKFRESLEEAIEIIEK